PPHAGGGAHGGGNAFEGLQPDEAVVVGVGEGAVDGVPVDGAGAGGAAVAFGEVVVAEVGRGLFRGGVEVGLFDVHVVGVEVHADIGLADHLDEAQGLFASVDEEGLVAVDGLDAER